VSYSIKDIAEALGLTSKGVAYRATKEEWPSVPRKGRGGGRAYRLEALPQAIQYALVQRAMGQVAQENAPGQECTAEQVAAILGVTKKHVDTRVRKERWKSKKRGDARVFVVGDLPQDIQGAFLNMDLVAPKDIRKRLQRLKQVATMLLREVELIEGMLGSEHGTDGDKN
jgi:hypothetical protein